MYNKVVKEAIRILFKGVDSNQSLVDYFYGVTPTPRVIYRCSLELQLHAVCGYSHKNTSEPSLRAENYSVADFFCFVFLFYFGQNMHDTLIMARTQRTVFCSVLTLISKCMTASKRSQVLAGFASSPNAILCERRITSLLNELTESSGQEPKLTV